MLTVFRHNPSLIVLGQDNDDPRIATSTDVVVVEGLDPLHQVFFCLIWIWQHETDRLFLDVDLFSTCVKRPIVFLYIFSFLV